MGVWAGRWMRASAGVALIWVLAMWGARVYDQNGGILCTTETGDQYKEPYVLVELALTAWLWVATVAAAGVTALTPASKCRRCVVALAVAHSLWGAFPHFWPGYCP